MITSFKIYETIINQGNPQKGDYVILHFKNQLGRIIEVIPNTNYTDNVLIDKTEYVVKWINPKDSWEWSACKLGNDLELKKREKRFDL